MAFMGSLKIFEKKKLFFRCLKSILKYYWINLKGRIISG
jgi:hypothetical protein